MAILDQLASSQFSYVAGISGSVTVPEGVVVTSIGCHISGASATLSIKPGGAGQDETQGPDIPLPPAGWFGLKFLGELGEGTVIVFTNTDSYFVFYSKLQ